MFNLIQKRVIEKERKNLAQLGSKIFDSIMANKPWYVSKKTWQNAVEKALTK
jgi:hypothetical protein